MTIEKTLEAQQEKIVNLKDIKDLFSKFYLDQNKVVENLNSHLSHAGLKDIDTLCSIFQGAFDEMKVKNLEKLAKNQQIVEEAKIGNEYNFMNAFSEAYNLDMESEKVIALFDKQNVKTISPKQKASLPLESCSVVEMTPHSLNIGLYFSKDYNTTISTGNELFQAILIKSTDAIHGTDFSTTKFNTRELFRVGFTPTENKLFRQDGQAGYYSSGLNENAGVPQVGFGAGGGKPHTPYLIYNKEKNESFEIWSPFKINTESSKAEQEHESPESSM